MDISTLQKYILIAPQIYVPLGVEDSPGAHQDPQPRRTEIPMTWIQEGNIFRLDIDLPDLSVLDLYFSTHVGSLHVNGETIWENGSIFSVTRSGVHAEITPSGLRLTCTNSGSIHILAWCIDVADTQLPVNLQNHVE